MTTKHETLAAILQRLGIEPDPSWFSRGSTITRDSLDAILKKVSRGEKEFDFETKPVLDSLRAIFIKFLRGFEDHYRILTGRDVIVRTDVLPGGEVGISLEEPYSRSVVEVESRYFTQWLCFATTGDPSAIDSFSSLKAEEQALILHNQDAASPATDNQQASRQNRRCRQRFRAVAAPYRCEQLH